MTRNDDRVSTHSVVAVEKKERDGIEKDYSLDSTDVVSKCFLEESLDNG